ncbi:glycosyltransferase [Chlorogloeopsis sp. ULAP01]|uniref:glycosyltransferase n=1 Tax=Chlorogloeopsis sp. ULAP01 TaxID=3056483 RepID=UPI0025AABB5D|nr:glycosyltransferase [Chlorogloeopsis sp. ULAP01]MDM9381597.1 glycosyltransferase [Chlorogloeopsis sp. ULAP01]
MVSNQTDSLNNEAFLPKVSVVVPIYNGEADLPDLINCLCMQTYPCDRVEYILVDNGSGDHTAEIIKQKSEDAQQQGIKIRYQSENKIQSSYAARNAGIRTSSGEIIVFTDADCRPQPDWLYAIVQPFANPTVGLVGGGVIALPGKTLLEKYAERKNILSHKDAAMHPFCPYAAGANLAIRRQTLREIGLFRPYLTTGGDADICWRIQRQSSWQFYCADQAVVQHRHRVNLRELTNQFHRYGCSHQYLKELYGTDVFQNIWNIKDYSYRWIGWLLKELPINVAKMIIGKATLLDLLITPMDLLIIQAEATGRRKAKLSEKAWQVEWL